MTANLFARRDAQCDGSTLALSPSRHQQEPRLGQFRSVRPQTEARRTYGERSVASRPIMEQMGSER